MSDVETTLAELGEVVGRICAALEPLSQGGRARVMLLAILTYAPQAFSNTELYALLQTARKP